MKFLSTLLAAIGLSAAHAETEIAPYQVLRSDGAYEVRDYPELVLVETQDDGRNESFRRLFRYISGSNDKDQEIPMTAPVFTGGRKTSGTMAFVMPKDMPEPATPKPVDPGLGIRTQPAGLYAVYRFTGWSNAKAEQKAADKLGAWVKENGFVPEGVPLFAYYDPPWTLPMFRRNEVMVRLSSSN